MSASVSTLERKPRAGKTNPQIRTELRAVDGARSPWYSALKRRADLRETAAVYRLELAEQRQLVVPWVRWPYFVYWRRRAVHSQSIERLEVVVRAFLETGHVPVQWWV